MAWYLYDAVTGNMANTALLVKPYSLQIMPTLKNKMGKNRTFTVRNLIILSAN